jgi:hypothetical protein
MRPFAQPASVDAFLSCGQRTRLLYGIASSSRSKRPPRWVAGNSSELAQDAPDVGLVIAHPALVLDQLAHPGRGPQPAGITERLGAALERPLDLPQLVRAQFGLTPGPAGFRPARPVCASCRAQRITDCRRTGRRRATSLWLTPSLSNSAVASRRRSSPVKSRRTPAALSHVSRLPCVSILYKIQ